MRSINVNMLLAFILAVSFTDVQSQWTITCNNTAIVAGRPGTLKFLIRGPLSESDFLEWRILRPTNETDNFAHLKGSETDPKIGQNFSHFSAKKGDDNSSWIFFIHNTTLEDAGNYTIALNHGRQEVVKYSCQVIVLESLPTCSPRCQLNHTYNTKELSCEVRFRGFWSPTIDWTISSCGGIFKHNETVFNTFVSSSITVPANFSFKNDICSTTIYFSRNDNEHLVMNATNTPDFVDKIQWKLPEIECISQTLNKAETNYYSITTGICLVISGIVVGLSLLWLSESESSIMEESKD